MGGKVTRLKGDLDDVDALLEIISVIKDVATNRFFTFAQRKANFQRFFDIFLDFFKGVEYIDSECPLLRNDNPKVLILTIASDQAFVSQLNSRVASITAQLCQKNPGARVISMGRRCVDRLKMLGVTEVDHIFTMDAYPDRYALAMAIRDYVVARIMDGQVGKVVIVHLWAKTFSVIKPRILTLLPASELVRTKGGDITEEENSPEREEPSADDKVTPLLESSADKIMRALADIWIHSRLYEIMSDILLVECAIQAQQLESALESLGSERKGLLVSFRKAGREELNKAMREVFTQTSFMRRG